MDNGEKRKSFFKSSKFKTGFFTALAGFTGIESGRIIWHHDDSDTHAMEEDIQEDIQQSEVAENINQSEIVDPEPLPQQSEEIQEDYSVATDTEDVVNPDPVAPEPLNSGIQDSAVEPEDITDIPDENVIAEDIVENTFSDNIDSDDFSSSAALQVESSFREDVYIVDDEGNVTGVVTADVVQAHSEDGTVYKLYDMDGDGIFDMVTNEDNTVVYVDDNGEPCGFNLTVDDFAEQLAEWINGFDYIDNSTDYIAENLTDSSGEEQEAEDSSDEDLDVDDDIAML